MQTDFRKDISYYKEVELRLEKKITREENKLDKALEIIQKYVEANRNLDIEQLVEIIIYRGWVTKDKLTRQKLYESTRALVEDYLTEGIEANYD